MSETAKLAVSSTRAARGPLVGVAQRCATAICTVGGFDVHLGIGFSTDAALSA